MTIADMSVVTAEVKVDETDIVNIQIGQPAEVTVDAMPGKSLQGPRDTGRRSGAAALHRRRHFAVHHRHRRGQGLQGRRHARHSHRRAAPRPLHHRQDHHRAQDQRALAAHPGTHHARLPTPTSRRQRQRPGCIHLVSAKERSRAGRLRGRQGSTANCAPSSSPSPPASPAPPTSKCSPASATARRSSPARTRLCAL